MAFLICRTFFTVIIAAEVYEQSIKPLRTIRQLQDDQWNQEVRLFVVQNSQTHKKTVIFRFND